MQRRFDAGVRGFHPGRTPTSSVCRSALATKNPRRSRNLTEQNLSTFDFQQPTRSTSPPAQKNHWRGRPVWELAPGLIDALTSGKGWAYTVDEGGGAFHGPKDFDIPPRSKMPSAVSGSCSTIQLDFNLPERSIWKYVAADGSPPRPIMITAPIFGLAGAFSSRSWWETSRDFTFLAGKPGRSAFCPAANGALSCSRSAEQAAGRGVAAPKPRSKRPNVLGKLNPPGRTAESPARGIGAREA